MVTSPTQHSAQLVFIKTNLKCEIRHRPGASKAMNPNTDPRSVTAHFRFTRELKSHTEQLTHYTVQHNTTHSTVHHNTVVLHIVLPGICSLHCRTAVVKVSERSRRRRHLHRYRVNSLLLKVRLKL